MTVEMKAFLPELISKMLEKDGISVNITRTANKDQSCLVLVNYQSRRICLLGDIKDRKTGQNKIGAAQIRVDKWQWASKEGFTTEEILDKLPDVVFKQVCPSTLHELLA